MMTRQEMERLNPGYVIRGTYRGPLDWELCTGLYDDLQQAQHVGGGYVFPAGTLYIVSQGDGYNIVRKERIQDGEPRYQIHCLRCTMATTATWDVNGYPYCETCAEQRARELLKIEGIVSRSHCPLGFTWSPGNTLVPITASAQ